MKGKNQAVAVLVKMLTAKTTDVSCILMGKDRNWISVNTQTIQNKRFTVGYGTFLGPKSSNAHFDKQ